MIGRESILVTCGALGLPTDSGHMQRLHSSCPGETLQSLPKGCVNVKLPYSILPATNGSRVPDRYARVLVVDPLAVMKRTTLVRPEKGELLS